MIVKYGNYAHAQNEVTPVISHRPNYNARGLPETTTVRWNLTGILQGDSQSELTTAINALRAAYSLNGQNLGLYLDDGTTLTSHSLLNSQTVGGTRVVDMSFPKGDGVEYVNTRTYSVAVEGDVFVASENVTEYDETLSFEGTGGPKKVFVETLEGDPQEQIGAQRSTYRATQQGRATGLLAYPTPNPPIWPAAERSDVRRIVYKAPRRVGLGFRDWTVEWTYVFESSYALAGLPHVV